MPPVVAPSVQNERRAAATTNGCEWFLAPRARALRFRYFFASVARCISIPSQASATRELIRSLRHAGHSSSIVLRPQSTATRSVVWAFHTKSSSLGQPPVLLPVPESVFAQPLPDGGRNPPVTKGGTAFPPAKRDGKAQVASWQVPRGLRCQPPPDRPAPGSGRHHTAAGPCSEARRRAGRRARTHDSEPAAQREGGA